MAADRHFVRNTGSPWLGGLCVFVFTFLCSLAIQGVLESEQTAVHFLSPGLWQSLVEFLGGDVSPRVSGQRPPSLGGILAINLGAGLLAWIAGAGLIAARTGQKFSGALGEWGIRGWLWGAVPAGWELARILAWGEAFPVFLSAAGPLVMACALAGWLATFAVLIQKPEPTSLTPETNSRRAFWGTVVAMLVYTLIFTAMNWQLYLNLLVPHGDSAMYEEHLWNFTHGKGFRSYLEDRLFLGEHLQVVHLLLLPLHLVWPSLMMMDLCESLALASAALPIYWITKRHTGSPQAGLLVALGYLLYFPMQYVDIAIDLKTFRPIAFGIPAVLYGLDQLERGRWKSAILCWLVALSAKEDYAIILAPLGLWIALFPSAALSPDPGSKIKTSRLRWLGLAMAVFNTLYLALAVKYIIPWFRSGQEVHYVGYFQQFGSSLEEVVKNILANPGLLFSELFAVTTPLYAASVLVPLGMMALFSPSRLLVGFPIFMLLCLNQIARTPQHHFHAPLIPILFWAAAAGVARFPGCLCRLPGFKRAFADRNRSLRWAAVFVMTSAVATGLFAGISPLGISFWDPHATAFWKKRYVISERAEMFERVIVQIPKTARVFSTDFVHPRFTHYERSYDYSDYPRETDQELTNPLPGETYYLVIDTRHPYSTIKTPGDIPEYREHPEDWELLPDQTEGYYIILRRRNE